MDQTVTLTLHDIAPALRLAVVMIEGLGAVNFINWLKGAIYRLFGIDIRGHKALILTLVVSIILAVGTLVIEGQITGASFEWQNIDKLAAIILIAAKARYDMLKRQQDDKLVALEPVDWAQLEAVNVCEPHEPEDF